MRYATCPDCRGKGHRESETCSTCEGNGTVCYCETRAEFNRFDRATAALCGCGRMTQTQSRRFVELAVGSRALVDACSVTCMLCGARGIGRWHRLVCWLRRRWPR
jgi:RecJ-like exonuclease